MLKFFKKPISPHLSPNASAKDVWFTIGQQLNPLTWLTWQRGVSISELESEFKRDFKASFAKSYDSGRTSLQSLLEALELTEEDDVVIQAFTCIVVPNAVIAAGATPVWVDIDETYNIDPAALEKLLQSTKQVKAVVVQHTFGMPADMDRILEICRRFKVRIIEDCAHSLGSKYQGKLVGSMGEMAMFSFGRDKVISSVSGGMAITNDAKVGQALNRFWLAYKYPSFFWIWKRLRHPALFAAAKRTYYFLSLGKVLIYLGKKFQFFPLVLVPGEKNGIPQKRQYKLPNVLAKWASRQYGDLYVMNEHRNKLADFYDAELKKVKQISLPVRKTGYYSCYLRYTIECDNPKHLLMSLRAEGILLGDWYHSVIVPCGDDGRSVKYVPGLCPKAELAASRVVNLPTNPETTIEEAKLVIKAVKKYFKDNV